MRVRKFMEKDSTCNQTTGALMTIQGCIDDQTKKPYSDILIKIFDSGEKAGIYLDLVQVKATHRALGKFIEEHSRKRRRNRRVK